MESNMHENKLDILFKSKLEDHTLDVNPSVWSNIESQLQISTPSSFWTVGKIISVSLGVITIGISSLYIIEDSNQSTSNNSQISKNFLIENKKIKNTDLNSTTQVDTSSTPSPKQNKATQIYCVSNKGNDEANTNTLNSISLPPVKKSANADSKKENAITREDKNNFKSNTEEIKDRVYMAGEFVTLQFEFQNVSGSDTKKVECWVEFPEWVDVNTVKTLNHSSTFELTAEAKPKFNTYIWHAHGNFSSDLNSLQSRGFIEYTFKITEAKKDSEINKIKPEVK
jgi:hypothetical protein